MQGGTCTLYLIPPSRNAQPSTSRQFERIEPSSETWTIRSIWKSGGTARTSAIAEMMTSVALPN